MVSQRSNTSPHKEQLHHVRQRPRHPAQQGTRSYPAPRSSPSPKCPQAKTQAAVARESRVSKDARHRLGLKSARQGLLRRGIALSVDIGPGRDDAANGGLSSRTAAPIIKVEAVEIRSEKAAQIATCRKAGHTQQSEVLCQHPCAHRRRLLPYSDCVFGGCSHFRWTWVVQGTSMLFFCYSNLIRRFFLSYRCVATVTVWLPRTMCTTKPRMKISLLWSACPHEARSYGSPP